MAGTSEQVANWLSRVVTLHDRIIARYGGAPGILDVSLLQAAIERPWTGLANGTQYYPGALDKAAVLLERVINYHAFVDGNKRTATILVFEFLREQGYILEAESGDIVDTAVQIAEKRMLHHDIVAWLDKVTPVRLGTFTALTPCPWCGSSNMQARTTSLAVGFGFVGANRARPEARTADYWVCSDCGVTFMRGDHILNVGDEKYLLHVPHSGADPLTGKVVTGPWWTEHGKKPRNLGSITVARDDVSEVARDHPAQHIAEIVRLIRQSVSRRSE